MSTNPPPSENLPSNWGAPPAWNQTNPGQTNGQLPPQPPPPPSPTPDWQNPQPPPPGWFTHDARRDERHRHRHGGSGWIWGLGLIALGVIFLLQNFGIFYMNNWWAIFILIPAVGAFASMVSSIQVEGRFTASAGSSLTGGLLLTFVSFIFFFNWSWGSIWPFFLIILGVGALASALARRP